MTDHPITPPPELVQQWLTEFYGETIAPGEATIHMATCAAQWGADQRGEVNEAKLQKARDQELAACCDWLREAKNHGFGYEYGAELARKLRAARRPKPPSLKEQGLQALEALQQRTTDPNIVEPLRLAVEALPHD